jgi:D-sedoheptulose 7-phosphate isomerase
MNSFLETASGYSKTLSHCLDSLDWKAVESLVKSLERVRRTQSQVFIFGNGGSGANAIHWANDLIYPITKLGGPPIRIHALPANPAVVTCLANDLGYDRIFEHPLKSFSKKEDVVIALSGSGNSPNILRALEFARESGMESFAILGFDGGKAKSLASVPIHIPINDMQIAEDLQMILCHIITQHLNENPEAQ